MPKKRRRKQAQTDPISYLVEIENWDWSYSFGINDPKHFDDPYSEYRHLQIVGRLLRPSSVTAQTVELTLIPDVRLNEINPRDVKPHAVGSLRLLE